MKKDNRITNDFNRDVWNLFGLPVDNLTMSSTKTMLRNCVQQKEQIVLSTINVNWVVQSFVDPVFRQAIINSDIVTLDGRPLVWLAKLLGYPMAETVPGSSLIQELQQDKDSEFPLTIFLFGGQDGVAEQAMQKINKSPAGLKAVGALNPGFGSVEQMSSDTIIDTINNTQPDILLVALGAQKGTQWIEHNRHRLNAKIISHLGATINFLAGSVPRAPKLLRTIGMEWVWRIIQEPKLFIRYAFDGLSILKFVAAGFYSWLYYLYSMKFEKDKSQPIIQKIENDRCISIIVGERSQVGACSPIRDQFCECVGQNKDILVDFQKTKFVDGNFLGLLILLTKHQYKNGKKLTIINSQGRLTRKLRIFCLNYLSFQD